MQTEETTENLLQFENHLVRAEGGKRFLNYIIDILIFYLLAMIIGVLLALISPSSLEWLANDSSGIGLLDRFVTLIIYATYMGLMESIFKGKSLGKLITGTRAVNLDGSFISTSTAFARGFSRAVPFCALSALGHPCDPWQDRWTDTIVMDEKKSMIN